MDLEELKGEITTILRSFWFWTGAALVGGVWMLRRYFAGGVCRSKASMVGKTVIITGANSGIGLVTTRDLSRRGARIIMACRNVQQADTLASDIKKETGNDQILVKELDLTSLTSVRRFAEEINKTESRLDVLLNNAGVMMYPYKVTEDGFEMQFGTNHLGHFLLTNLLLDLIKSSAPSRIINVSSLAHKHVILLLDDLHSEKNYNSTAYAYGRSKLANIYFTTALAKRLEGTGVTVNCNHPGLIKTNLDRHLMENSLLFKIVWFLLYPIALIALKTPVEGAQTQIHLAVSEEVEGVTGKYFSDCAVEKLAPHARITETEERLWTLSEKWVGLA